MFDLVILTALALNEFFKGVDEGYIAKFLARLLHDISNIRMCLLTEHQGLCCNAWQIASCYAVF
jgi:hypothetical protein